MIVKLFDINNNEFYCNDILEFSFISRLKSPVSRLYIKLKVKNLFNFCKIKLYYNQYIIFEGNIDKQINSKYANNITVTILSRSTAAILLDNQAQPQMYSNISFNDILNNHIIPYGFSSKYIDHDMLPIYLPSFIILPYTSEWSVLTSFTQQAFNLIPFIYDEKFIKLSNSFPHSNLTISNHVYYQDSEISYHFNYSHISVQFNGCNIVSGISNNNNLSSKKINIKKQNNEFLLISLTIPTLFPTKIGHKVNIIDDIIPKKVRNNEFIINQLNYTFKNNELITNLILSSKEYVV